MHQYCVNRQPQPTGEHEVHNLGANCPYLPEYKNQYELGSFSDCSTAISVAKVFYNSVDGCAHCCPDCHTR
jgi:hypothetical protein